MAPTEAVDGKPGQQLVNQSAEQDNQVLDEPGAGVTNQPPAPVLVTTEINQVSPASPRQLPEGAKLNRQDPTVPIILNRRAHWQQRLAQSATVFVKGLMDSTSELTFMEWLNSLGGAFNRRSMRLKTSAVNGLG